jgi:hypothetical protein
MNELNNKLDGLNELITRIDAKILEINTKLDAVIAAIHEYDDDQLEWPEPNDALLKAAGLYNELEANKRMDIIGQNGNEGIHYVTNEEADEDARSNNNPANTRVDKNNVGRNKGKKRNERNNEIPDFKHTPPPPKPKRKSAIEEHIKYPPHKH